MIENKFKYIYGPVYSWRLGMSLGIDPLTTQKKICNYDCIYCQLGRTTEFYTEREDFVRVEDIMAEIGALPPGRIDFYTFSGRGEPTLAKNLGAMIAAVRDKTQGKVAVITNAALIDQKEVQDDLMLADLVLAKLDASDDESLAAVDIPAHGLRFRNIVAGIKSFRKRYAGRLALQIMFIEENKKYAKAIAEVAREIAADEIQINTPLRPGGTPLNEAELSRIKKYFKGLPALTVYEAERRTVEPFDDRATILRHGNFKKKAKY
jgi:wyosine [tRNA(Phe)-imidazoG37] synthetase (radical SAM superfamily)